MDGERWKRVDELLQSALRLPAGQQKEFLRNACAGDVALQTEVLSLLSAHGKLGNFLEEPPVTVATLSGFPEAPAQVIASGCPADGGITGSGAACWSKRPMPSTEK